MDIFSLFTLCGGLAFFLFGMSLLSSGLEKMAGGKLESLLKKSTESPLRGLLLGVAITAGIQSSSAVTVMLVGLVNSGIMQLGQTVSVIMGSNIGTTFTAWILGLSGLESDNLLIRLMNPESFSPLLALFGMLIIMICKSDRKKSVGNILLGFSILISGLDSMRNALAPLAENTIFVHFLALISHPLMGVIIGAVFTALIHSSAASVGVLQALAMNGVVNYSMAIPVVMGQNIGTCVTAIISSIGVNKNAKRVSTIHMLFNLIGTVIYLILYCIAVRFIKTQWIDMSADALGIAMIHSLFNIGTAVVLFPFWKHLEKLANLIIKDTKTQEGKEEKEIYSFIDDRLLSTPSVAIRECGAKCKAMAELSMETIFLSLSLVEKYDEKTHQQIMENEDLLDLYEDKLGTYLGKLSGRELSEIDGKSVSQQLHTISDFERMGDHAVNVLKIAEEMHSKKIRFSEETKNEVSVLSAALTEIINTTIESYSKNSISVAKRVEPLEEAIDSLIVDVKSRHMQRLKDGEYSIELGFVLSDLLTNLERISDHCSNVAIAVIETSQLSFDAHEYSNTIKQSGNKEFKSEYEMYKSKYSIE